MNNTEQEIIDANRKIEADIRELIKKYIKDIGIEPHMHIWQQKQNSKVYYFVKVTVEI